jgi:phthalate 4,5-dioxygenase
LKFDAGADYSYPQGKAMLTKAQNDQLTLTGPGTPGGSMLRRYWHPVALSAELKPERPLPVRVLSEDLVLFRDARGAPRLVERHCPHRGADLSLARIERGMLRCLYHGWLFSGDGACVDRPGEGAKAAARLGSVQNAYPCFEGGGLIMAYLGPAPAPRPPSFPFFSCPGEQVWVSKLFHRCNYLQASEGNIDPQHLSFLHRFLPGAAVPYPDLNEIVTGDVAPRIEVVETAFGLRILASRHAAQGRQQVRMTNFIIPNASAFTGFPLANPDGTPNENYGFQFHWHVPIDDGSHWKYMLVYNGQGRLDKNLFDEVIFKDISPAFKSSRTAENGYLQDREEMQTATYTGLGRNPFDHDKYAVESQGRIVDRSKEHLSTTDKAIVQMRRQMLKAVDDVLAGRDPLFVEREGQPDALQTMVTISATLPATTDMLSDWWRGYGG